MGALETLIVYAVLGAVVAGAMWLQQRDGGAAPWALLLWATCWPLFAPILLTSEAPAAPTAGSAPSQPGWSARIARAEALLEQKLATLEGTAAATLTHETGRIRQLQAALDAMAARLAEMDAVLATPEFDVAEARRRLDERSTTAAPAADPALESLAARLANIRELERLRERTLVELERALYRIEEMSSRLALLRFTEGRDRDADALIDEISGTIDDITEAILAVA